MARASTSGRHSRAGVGDRDPDELAGPMVRGLVQPHPVGGDGQGPAFGHGVAGVDGEVEDRVFELVGVAHAMCRAGIEPGLDPDLSADRVAEQALHRLDHRVDRDRRHADPLDPRESEQLAGQLGAAPGRFERGLGDPLEPRVLDPRGDHLQPAHDRGEEIVEIVGDAAGELADRLHLLGLAERLLRLQALADLRLQPVEGGAEIGCPLRDPPLQSLVDLAKRRFGALQLGDVVGDADEAAYARPAVPSAAARRSGPSAIRRGCGSGRPARTSRARPRRPWIRRRPGSNRPDG